MTTRVASEEKEEEIVRFKAKCAWTQWKFDAAVLLVHSDPCYLARVRAGAILVVWVPTDADEGKIDTFESDREVDEFFQTTQARRTLHLIIRDTDSGDSGVPPAQRSL